MKKENINVQKELAKFDKEMNKKSMTALKQIGKFVMLLVVVTVWYYLIKLLRSSYPNKSFFIYLYLVVTYLIFNIMLFGHMQIDYKKKSKTKEARKDVKLVIIISKILVVINYILISLLGYYVYINNGFNRCLVYFMPLFGFNTIFFNLAYTLNESIIKHKKMDNLASIIGVISIIIGIILYFTNGMFDIFKIINTL